MQRLTALAPKAAEVFQSVDVPSATEVIVKVLFRNPVERIVSDEGTFEITALALAHQWGRTQLALDTVLRYERLFTQRHADLQRKKKGAGWANFLLALSSAGYAMGNVSATPAQRFSNELGMARNEQTVRFNRLLSESYQSRIESLEEARLKVGELKQQLVGYSNLLEIYRDWLFKAQEAQQRQMVPAAQGILTTKATGI